MAATAKDQWLERQQGRDRERKAFYGEMDQSFPNLFCLQPLFQNRPKAKAEYLLKKQQTEREAGGFQYQMENDRCENLIVFLFFLLDRRTEALHFCEKFWRPSSDKDLIRLTNLAALQWEMGQREKARKTLKSLHQLKTTEDLQYLRSVALSEQGHAFICFGPEFFMQAVDLLQKALESCPQIDTYLWKYDLAIAIRRNFVIFVYRKHDTLSDSQLAKKAMNLLQDVSQNCPNNLYRARSLAEIGNLVSALLTFKDSCSDDAEKESMAILCSPNYEYLPYIRQALDIPEGNDDHFVLRVAGRLYMYDKQYTAAQDCLCRSIEKREDSITYQQLAKVNLRIYDMSTSSQGTTQHDTSSRKHQGVLRTSRTFPAENTQLPIPCPGAEGCWSSQEERLSAEFDDSLLIRDDGSYKANETERVGNIRKRHPPASLHTGTGCWSSQEERLSAEFDDSLLIRDDGSYKANETERVGNIRKRHPPASLHTGTTAHSSRGMAASRTSSLSLRPRTFLKSTGVRYGWYDRTNIQIQQAETYFKKAFDLNQYNSQVLYDIGLMYEGLDELDKAYEYFQKILNCSDVGSLDLVNAYEHSGLCLLEMSTQVDRTAQQQKDLVEKAEDMFLSSLGECHDAVSRLHKVNFSHVWKSYSRMVHLLQNPRSPGNDQQQKLAKVHEYVGKHLEAISALHKDLLDPSAQDPLKRKRALLGLVRNHYSLPGHVARARLFCDMCMEEGYMTADDADETSQELHLLAMKVYRKAASQALETGSSRDAVRCFKTALKLKGLVRDGASAQDVPTPTNPVSHQVNNQATYDVCIFDECDSERGDVTGPISSDADRVAAASAALATILEHVFGMSVSLNAEGVPPGCRSWERQQLLARTATCVVLVMGTDDELSPRMATLTDCFTQTHRTSRVLPVVVADNEKAAPFPLDSLKAFPGAPDLLIMDTANVEKFMTTLASHHDTIMRLFDFVAKPDLAASQAGHLAN